MDETKAFAYLRVSGKGQVSGDGFPRQLSAIEGHAAGYGLKIVRVFEEKGVRGATEWGERPAWAGMVQSMNGVRTVVIERLDRVARDLMVQEHIIADLRRRGIALISTEEPDLDSENPTRVLMRQIMGAIAQYDKAMIVEKLRGARQRMKARDGRCEGRKPFGHYGGEKERLEVLLALGREMNAANVAVELNRRGLLTRGGGHWHPYTVGRIISRQPAIPAL